MKSADQRDDLIVLDLDRTTQPPPPRNAARRGPSIPGRLMAGSLAALGLAAALVGFEGSGSASVPPPPAPPKPDWLEIRRPLALFSLEAPEFAGKPAQYEARRHATGGGRRDEIALGGAAPGEARLRVSIYRRGTEPVADAGFFVEMARRAAAEGASVLRSAQPGPMQTRFGAFEAGDIVVQRGGVEAACVGFRLPGDGVLAISGYSCPGDGPPLERAVVACQIDRLDLLSSGEDRPLREVFVAAELKRDRHCAASRAASHGRKSWLEPRAELPALKGSARGRGG